MSQKDADGITIPGRAEWDAARLSQGYIADYKPFNFVDGEGVRCSIYVSGCPFKCPGCYNKAAQSFRYGKPFDDELEERIFADLAQPYVSGLSFVGGEPFLNTGVLLRLARRLREEHGHDKTIWVWSGYTYDQLIEDTPDKIELLKLSDVLVDGPFIRRLYHHDLAFRGSSNQRIIDLPASRAAGEVVLWHSSGRDSEGHVPFVNPAPPTS